MGQETYHIPKEPTAFFHFQDNAVGLCTPNATAWNIPADTMTNIAPLQAAYINAYSIASNRATQSPAATKARNTAQAALSTALDNLYRKNLLNNDAIDSDDKTALHIHNTANGGGKPAPAPATTPALQLITEGISQLYIVYADSATPNKHHKPANVAFDELWVQSG